ncbi:MAG: mannose-1-phosphate guanylyltransferase [Gemmatimonadetes bacterium]|nr:mannose-1-phosphate guanylyltransferase [Gemmatimonadota bacterium]
MSEPERWVTILAGGIGARFWPLSTPRRPKQVLPLVTAEPLIADTAKRALAIAPLERVVLLSGRELTATLLEAAPALRGALVLDESTPRGTGPALARAAWEILRRSASADAVMVSLHADHFVRPVETFVKNVETAIAVAHRHRMLVTIGARPTRPETGFGYMELDEELRPGVRRATRFVEKPDMLTATRFVASDRFLWNTGIFAWRAQDLLEEARAVAPELARPLVHLEAGDPDRFFKEAPALSIDEGVLERSRRVAVVFAGFEWDDVGSWAALLRVRERSAEGNALVGDAHAVDCKYTLVWAEDGAVVAYGMEHCVVVRAGNLTLVTTRERAADLKKLLARLPQSLAGGVE